jgi:hypothetical protein
MGVADEDAGVGTETETVIGVDPDGVGLDAITPIMIMLIHRKSL